MMPKILSIALRCVDPKKVFSVWQIFTTPGFEKNLLMPLSICLHMKVVEVIPPSFV